MARCDVCEGTCEAGDLAQLLEPYRSPGIVDVCPACRKWADQVKRDEIVKASDRIREAIAFRRAFPPAPAARGLFTKLRGLFT